MEASGDIGPDVDECRAQLVVDKRLTRYLGTHILCLKEREPVVDRQRAASTSCGGGAAVATQSPIKVSAETKDRIRFLAALTDATQAEIVDRAIGEYAARHADEVAKGLDRAREVLSGGDAAIAALLLDESPAAVRRVAGRSRATNAR